MFINVPLARAILTIAFYVNAKIISNNIIAKADLIDWLKLEQPNELIPLTWCTHTGIGTAIPLYKHKLNKLFNKNKNIIENDQLKQIPIKKSQWKKEGENCKSSIILDFYNFSSSATHKKKLKKNRHELVSAYVGFASYDDCGTTKTVVDNRSYYINKFSPYQTDETYLVVCNCNAISKKNCHPSIKKLEKDHSYSVNGQFLNVRASIGNDSQKNILFSNNRYVFRFESPSKDYKSWPKKCSLGIEELGHNKLIIDDFCAVDVMLDLKYHKTDEEGVTTISTKPFEFANNSKPQKISCELVLIDAKNVEKLLDECKKSKYTDKYNSIRKLQEDRFRKSSVSNQFIGKGVSESKVLDDNTFIIKRFDEIYEKELRQRINKLEMRLMEGDFDNYDTLLKVSNDYADQIRESEQVSAGQIQFEPPNYYQNFFFRGFSFGTLTNIENAAQAITLIHPAWHSTGSYNRSSNRAAFQFGTHGNSINLLADRSLQDIIAGYSKKLYGVQIEASANTMFTAYEVRARNVNIVSTIDTMYRIVGVRVSVRNFGLSIRQDLDDFIMPTFDIYGTEIYFTYKSLAIGFGADILNARYFVTIGLLGVNVAAAREFNAYGSTLQINWGRGWQLFIQRLQQDMFGVYNGFATGFGKPTRRYVSAGAGVTSEELLVGAVNAQGYKTAIQVGLLEKGNLRLQQYSFTVGRNTYTWESAYFPENILFLIQ